MWIKIRICQIHPSTIPYFKTIRNCFPPPPPPPPPPPTTLIKIFPATSQSSSTKTTEPIVKCHTILEMGNHDLSPHTFRTGPPFWKGAQKGVKKTAGAAGPLVLESRLKKRKKKKKKKKKIPPVF